MNKVIIAGGGTGGHIFPAVAIAHALQHLQQDIQLQFVGAEGKMEMEKVPQEGFKIIGLDIAGFNRSNLLKNWNLPYKLWKSRKRAMQIINEFQPDVLIGVGGFASFPMLHAAQSKGIPTLIQEQNSFAGKSNKILGKKANAICVAYENMERFFPKDKIILTGNPVRKQISNSRISKEEGALAFGLSPQIPTLFIVGGSLGARSINQAILNGLPQILDMGLQVIWQTGKGFYTTAQEAAKGRESKIKVHEFIRNMEYAYAAADMVISRAGALAIAELCIVGKPVIFVPYPFAAEDHQTSNAMALANHNAALMVRDQEVETELIKKLESLVKDDNMQIIMSQNIQKMAKRDADITIAERAIELINNKKQ